MVSDDEYIDELGFLVRTPTRVRILDAVNQEGPLDTATLRDRFDCDRTTITRNLDDLAEHGWIQQTNHTIRITRAGELVASELPTWIDTTRTAMHLKQFLQGVSIEAFDLDLDPREEAEILLPESGDPYAMINRQVELVRQSHEIYGFLRVTGLHAAEAGHEMIVDNEGRMELVVTPDVANTFFTKPAYAELIEEMLDTGRFHLFVCD